MFLVSIFHRTSRSGTGSGTGTAPFVWSDSGIGQRRTVEPSQGADAPPTKSPPKSLLALKGDGSTSIASASIASASIASASLLRGKKPASSSRLVAVLSLYLAGDVRDVAEGTEARGRYCKQVVEDVWGALAQAVKGDPERESHKERIFVEGVRGGEEDRVSGSRSIVVDFRIVDFRISSDSGGDSTGSSVLHLVSELKRQLLTPTSKLLQGAVTRDSLKLVSEVEVIEEEEEEGEGDKNVEEIRVSRSGTFLFSNPHTEEEGAMSRVPGGATRDTRVRRITSTALLCVVEV